MTFHIPLPYYLPLLNLEITFLYLAVVEIKVFFFFLQFLQEQFGEKYLSTLCFKRSYIHSEAVIGKAKG